MDSCNVTKCKIKKRKKRNKENVSPAKDRTWVASVLDEHDNHYTTPIADSNSEMKYLYR